MLNSIVLHAVIVIVHGVSVAILIRISLYITIVITVIIIVCITIAYNCEYLNIWN